MENLHWLGHASFRLDGKRVIYFDPWKLGRQAKKANFIFVSHEHFDHFSVDDIKLISTKETVIMTDKTCARQLENKGVICRQISALAPQDTLQIEGIEVNAVASYNINKQFHARNSKKLGFIVSVEGVKVYHAGDTDKIPEMKDYRCDVALLPVSGTYVMTAGEAAEAALLIKPKLAIPMHYGDIVGTASDADKFKDLLKGKIEVKILEKES